MTETNGFELSVAVRLRRSSHGEQYRRDGLDPVQDARTGFRRRARNSRPRQDRPARQSPPCDEWQLARQRPKSQVPTFTYDFPRRHHWPAE